MFQWDKSIQAVNVTADKVVHLFRSMREVQLALPGVPAQQASAYLCQYMDEGGVATVAVFHLHKSDLLAFYFSEPKIVPQQKTDSMLDQGLNFVESMGFLLTDQDIHLLETSDQEMLWESLPLKTGLEAAEDAIPPAPAKTKPAVAAPVADAPKPTEPKQSAPDKPAPPQVAAAEPMPSASDAAPEELSDEAGESVDDLLAAVEAMRAKRPGLRARKVAPSAEEMNRRKDQLRQTVGRILASL